MRRSFLIHALSPLHPGTGQAVALIDLPIARLKATGIPFLPGSSIKGVLRDALRPQGNVPKKGQSDPVPEEWHQFWAAFGPDQGEAAEHAGALVFGDARLLCLPVRSLRGTFAYVTCPLLLRLSQQDEPPGTKDLQIPALAQGSGEVTADSVLRFDGQDGSKKVYLEDLDLAVSVGTNNQGGAQGWGTWLEGRLFGQMRPGELRKRFLIVDDETMTFLWETATQVDARVSINDTTGVVREGGLWYEESLPAETVLLGQVSTTSSRRPLYKKDAAALLGYGLDQERDDLQFGGKATVGRGRVRLLPLK